MKVLITGIDGYLGWTLALHLMSRGHEIVGIDKFLRRKWVTEVGGDSVIPIYSMKERLAALKEQKKKDINFYDGDLCQYDFVEKILKKQNPDAIIHLGEMPSASYSMIDVEHAVFTQMNNMTGTLNLLYAMRNVCPDAHLVKLGTMGEYGTPNIDIPEGFFEVDYRGRRDILPFPRQAGSWYHWSKVHDSNNIMFACRIWGLRSTDIMQGVVFGSRIEEMGDDERLRTRFDIDQCFGTVINRYCAQAVIGHPLTPYGAGLQKRGFLPLRDSMQCLTLSLENPPSTGKYRVFNQFEEVFDVTDLARKVQRAGKELGLPVEVRNLENPRLEREEHYYNPDHQNLFNLGYKPTLNVDEEIVFLLKDLLKYRNRIEMMKSLFIPDIRWHGQRQKVNFIR
jgi:UDP-sulfoquinovose synthase